MMRAGKAPRATFRSALIIAVATVTATTRRIRAIAMAVLMVKLVIMICVGTKITAATLASASMALVNVRKASAEWTAARLNVVCRQVNARAKHLSMSFVLAMANV